MDMSGEREITAPREQVWAALNDPEVLKAAIPGCQSIEKTSDTQFDAKVKAKVGPVNATFGGTVNLSNIDPPKSYTISGEGSGGAAGFAKGRADVSLENCGDSTRLSYTVNAQVGGKLAQLGQRLIKSTANKYATQFFDNFAEKVAPTPAATSEGEPEASIPEASTDAATTDSATSSETAGAAPESPVQSEDASASTAPGTTESAKQPAERGGIRPIYWIGSLIVLILILLAVFST